jgi:hypothetical protein
MGRELMITAFGVPMDTQQTMVLISVETRRGRVPNFLKRWVLSPFLKLALRQDSRALKQQSENTKNFGEERFCLTPLDLMMPYIRATFQGRNVSMLPQERHIEFEL